MIFLTVGTQFPFERLVKAVDDIFEEGLIEQKIFAQTGDSSYKPRNFESVAFLDKEAFDKYLKAASGIIGHAGMGTIAMALDNHKPLLVMPRLKQYGEVINNHQVPIARKFSELGHLLAAYDVNDLPERIRQLRNFVPRERKASPHSVVNRIRSFLSGLTQVNQD